MAVMNVLRRLAAAAAAPTFVIAGAGGGDVEALALDARVTVVASPRHATVLLVAGALPESLVRAASLVHDALPHPRATVWWSSGDSDVQWLGDAPSVSVTDDPAAAVTAVHAELMYGTRRSEPAIIEETNRSPWRGVGPYGHGGSGMTGGEPYGRPLTEREDDPRDGLSLDVLPVTVGPFFPALPAGLTINISLHGDVVGAAQIGDDPFLDSRTRPVRTHEAVFDRAVEAPVTVAALERARVSHHLRAISRTLRLHGLGAFADRALAVAVDERPNVDEVRRLLTIVERTGLTRVGAGVGVVGEERAAGRGLGLAARASGVADDARQADPAYAELDFRPVTHRGGDARARLCQRIGEARQSLRLAEDAGERVRYPGPPVEDPRLSAAIVADTLEEVLIGAEWGDAVTTIDSFDIVMGLPASHGVTAAA